MKDEVYNEFDNSSFAWNYAPNTGIEIGSVEILTESFIVL